MNWGYCPEDPELTKQRLHIYNVKAVGDKERKFVSGDCHFPYMIDDYKLIYKCSEDKLETGEEYSWCPVKLKKGNMNKYNARPGIPCGTFAEPLRNRVGELDDQRLTNSAASVSRHLWRSQYNSIL